MKIEDPLCQRYSCLQVENIKRNVSPVNMRIRLYYCGLRGINFLADLTNYLMLEMGPVSYTHLDVYKRQLL